MNSITVLNSNQLYQIDLQEDNGTIRMVNESETYVLNKVVGGYTFINKDNWKLYVPLKTIGELIKIAAHDYPKAKFYNGNYPITV
jgi:hypothetical protein